MNANNSQLPLEIPIGDAISRIQFAPNSNNLLISSWDSVSFVFVPFFLLIGVFFFIFFIFTLLNESILLWGFFRIFVCMISMLPFLDLKLLQKLLFSIVAFNKMIPLLSLLLLMDSSEGFLLFLALVFYSLIMILIIVIFLERGKSM
jgi:hypothetical protein